MSDLRRLRAHAVGGRAAPMPRLGRSMTAMALVAAVVTAGCSSTADDADPVATGPVTAAAPSGPDFVRNSSESDAGSTTGSGSADAADEGPAPASTAIAPVPDTGVPGIDSDDAFCRSWSEFAGSFQALGLVSAFGDPAEALRLEVLAAAAVVDAAARLAANLPTELEAEREALLDDFAGPFVRRAERAQAELVDAGVDRPDDLRAVWLEQLAASGVDDPAMTVVLPRGIDAGGVDAAVAAFAAALPPIVDDPSLITGATITQTEGYLAANCPDQGILGGNDVVSS